PPGQEHGVTGAPGIGSRGRAVSGRRAGAPAVRHRRVLARRSRAVALALELPGQDLAGALAGDVRLQLDHRAVDHAGHNCGADQHCHQLPGRQPQGARPGPGRHAQFLRGAGLHADIHRRHAGVLALAADCV
ncbi:hypothetical protein IWW55_005348, partial [Coemansia sp. RSA 2706]